MPKRYLRAEELARMAGLAKSTILAAIRRGEIRSSRTLGRGTRIPIDSAREYLANRSKEIPDQLRESRTSAIAVVSERGQICERIRGSVQPHWTVNHSSVYSTLLWVGVHAPSWVVIDLEIALFNPFHVLRALSGLGQRAPQHIAAVASHPALLVAARALGATVAVPANDVGALLPLINGERG